MAEHKMKVLDGSPPVSDEVVTVKVERFAYEVLAEAGLFKNGELFEQGSTIMLDRDTAARFETVGEVKEIK